MAYVPDQAFDDKTEVGGKPFELFCFYCRHGSMSNNRVSVSLEAGAKFLGISYENASRCNAVLKKKNWIVLDAGEIILLKGWEVEKIDFRSRRNRQKLTKTAIIDTSKIDDFSNFEQKEVSEFAENSNFLQSESENDMSEIDENSNSEQSGTCQKLTKTAISPLQPLKGYINNSEPPLLKPILERENINAQARAKDFPGFEPFAETAKLVDEKFRQTVDETLFWIQRDKQLSRRNFPAKEWLDCIEQLQPEGIELIEGDGGFKDFYEWAGSEDWVETVTPKLLLGQIEKYKKRDIIARKRKRTGGKYENGNSYNNRTGSNSGQTKNGVQTSRNGNSETTEKSLSRTNAKPKNILR